MTRLGKTILLLAALPLFAIMGCTSVPLDGNRAALSAVYDDAVVASAGGEGGKTVSIRLVTAQEAGYQSQAIVHRWLENDIYQYEVSLKVFDGSGYVDLKPALSVVVPRKLSPKSKAVFTNLKQGKKYQVSVVAKGNVNGTAATSVLNSVPAIDAFDFTGTQDVQDSLSADLRISFDAVGFSGSGDANILSPQEGAFQNTIDAETGSAQ